MAYIELRGICKAYKNGNGTLNVLDHLDFEIERGDRVSVMGRSGSGKTTLLNVMAGLVVPDCGSYAFSGEEIDYRSERVRRRLRNQKIGYIPQNIPLLFDRTVLANVKLPLQYRRNHEVKDNDIFELASHLKIETLLDEMPSRLSGGERQKVGILRVLAQKAELILADEPTGSLDEKSEEEILEILKELNQGGKTILMITHDQNVARICGRRYWLRQGRLTPDSEGKR
ncbi:ATP-binding cassette domain-containing protein [Beduinella massiliensis]|uniref:ATP-binding cassette domain-containing protein n=1 Tax=Beduinella massiliensis TaxID=1852363 RepID=UPI000C858FA4